MVPGATSQSSRVHGPELLQVIHRHAVVSGQVQQGVPEADATAATSRVQWTETCMRNSEPQDELSLHNVPTPKSCRAWHKEVQRKGNPNFPF